MFIKIFLGVKLNKNINQNELNTIYSLLIFLDVI